MLSSRHAPVFGLWTLQTVDEASSPSARYKGPLSAQIKESCSSADHHLEPKGK